VKVKWLGHACFLITSEGGLRIITDPYAVGGGIEYGRIAEAADIVTVSHKHGDHDNVSSVKGKPEVMDSAGARKAGGVDFRGIASYHDEARGGQRGANIIYCFTLDGIRVCHLGDLGHRLDAGQLADIGQVDVLLVPVGGNYTIDAKVASEVCESLKPKVVIPMHYKTDKCTYPIAGVDGFLKGRPNVRHLDSTEIELKKDELPAFAETVVLRHAL